MQTMFVVGAAAVASVKYVLFVLCFSAERPNRVSVCHRSSHGYL